MINFLLGAFIDTTGRFVAEQADRLRRQALGKHDFLLVAATHGFHGQIEGRDLDLQALDHALGQFVFLAGTDH
ncbi:hypothetical protein D3C80_1976760 [compost metagenome]